MGLPETEAGVQVKITGGVSNMVLIGRSNSYRLFVAALGCLAALLVAQSSWADQVAPKSNEEAKAAAEHSQRRTDDQERRGETLTKLQKVKPAAEGEETPNWSNWWLDPMATFNAMLVVLTVVLAAFGISQYFTSRGLTRRQLRAYVFADSISLLDGAMAKPVNSAMVDQPGAIIFLKNTGQTPARNVVHWGAIDVIECRHEEVLKIPPFQPASNAPIPTQGVINKTVAFNKKITQSEKDGILKGTHAIYVYGRVNYSDIFLRDRFTEYRFRYHGIWPPPETHSLNFCDVGNSHS